MTLSLRPALRRPRAVLALPLASLVILCGGWSALWLFAAREAGTLMDGWMAREAERGRIWSCADRAISGFPFGIELHCRNPAFAGPVGHTHVEARAAGLTAHALITQPNAAEADIEGPLTVSGADPAVETRAEWANLHVTVRGLAGARLARAEVDVDGLSVARADGSGGRAERVELHVEPALQRAIEDHALDIRLSVEGAAVPLADGLTGSAAPMALDTRATLTQAALAVPVPRDSATPEEVMEAWRQAGGRLDLVSLNLDKGPLAARLSGTLGLDGQHRPEGRLDVAMSGADQLARNLGLPPESALVGGLLGKLLAGPAAAASGPPALRLPLVLHDGRVAIGPVRLGLRLAPLY